MPLYLSRNITTSFMALELLLALGVGLYLVLEAQLLVLRIIGFAVLLDLLVLLGLVLFQIHRYRRNYSRGSSGHSEGDDDGDYGLDLGADD